MAPGFGQEFGSEGDSQRNSVEEIITDVLKAGGINSTDTDYRERALIFLNAVYRTVLKGRHWKFLQRELFLDLKAPYSTGTVDIAVGEYLVECADAPPTLQWDASMIGQLFIPSGAVMTQHRVREVPTGTTLNLFAQYAEDEDAEGLSYEILFDRVTLEAGVQAIRSLSVSGGGEIKPTGRQEFYNMKAANPGLKGSPRFYTLVEANAQSGYWTLEVFPAPDKRYTLHADVSLRVTELLDEDTCYSLVPPEHKDVLYYNLLSEIYRYQENPAMVEYTSKKAAMAWSTFASDHEMTDSVARIQSGGDYHGRIRRRRAYPGFYGLNWFGKVEA